MVGVDVSIDEKRLAEFERAFSDYSKALKKDSATAPRRAAIQLCKSLRAGTRVAKKNKGMTVAKSYERPPVITYRNGVKLDNPLRRIRVNLTDRGRSFDRFFYGRTLAENKRDARKQVGTNYYQKEKRGGTRGLAKQSWGWVMHNIFNGAAPDTPWKRRKRDKRNPKDVANGSLSRPWYALIWNRLDYAQDALKISLSQAVEKAAHWMEKEAERRSFRV